MSFLTKMDGFMDHLDLDLLNSIIYFQMDSHMHKYLVLLMVLNIYNYMIYHNLNPEPNSCAPVTNQDVHLNFLAFPKFFSPDICK
jgi:hypothetical protein